VKKLNPGETETPEAVNMGGERVRFLGRMERRCGVIEMMVGKVVEREARVGAGE